MTDETKKEKAFRRKAQREAAYRFSSDLAEDPNWEHAFEEAGLPLADVASIIGAVDGEFDGDPWVVYGLLTDGRWFYLTAGCGYSGWDTTPGGVFEVRSTVEVVERHCLTKEDRRRLGVLLPPLEDEEDVTVGSTEPPVPDLCRIPDDVLEAEVKRRAFRKAGSNNLREFLLRPDEYLDSVGFGGWDIANLLVADMDGCMDAMTTGKGREGVELWLRRILQPSEMAERMRGNGPEHQMVCPKCGRSAGDECQDCSPTRGAGK